MSFTDITFVCFFIPLVFLAYNLFRKHWPLQNVVLLLASLYFYYCFGLDNLVILVFCILFTYAGGYLGTYCRRRSEKAANTVFITTAVLNLCILVFFKYALFTVSNLNLILSKFSGAIPLPDIALPIGLSFFIFQSSSYLFDLKNKKVECEKNPITYALFVSFFPSIVSGPIQKSRELLPKLRQPRAISYRAFQRALFVFLWGIFIKMVIADRLAIFTAAVFENYAEHGGFTLLLGAAMYSVQIYTDFAGYSYMAIGCGILFGFELQDNFMQPYFATGIVDFWRRWHISLTSWFREYLYFPLGGNRKGVVRKYLNVLIVFLVSGLWHGAAWSFVVWGFVHALYQVCAMLTQPLRNNLYPKFKIDTASPVYRIWQSVCVFFLATVAWIFFRLSSIKDAFLYVFRMLTQWNPWVLFDYSLLEFGLSATEWNVMIAALVLLFVVSLLREKGVRSEHLAAQKLPLRWGLYLLLIAAIIIFGIYGPGFAASDFIYAGF